MTDASASERTADPTPPGGANDPGAADAAQDGTGGWVVTPPAGVRGADLLDDPGSAALGGTRAPAPRTGRAADVLDASRAGGSPASGGTKAEPARPEAGADPSPGDPTPAHARTRHRLTRAGIQNVWQYDDHVFHFADGRLLLRGRNGAGKSKALEMLLPFLLDGDARRLDTTGTSRTSLRWLLLDGRTPPPEDDTAEGTDTGDTAGPGEGEDTEPATAILGYLWVEFTRDPAAEDTPDGAGTPDDGGRPGRITLGAAITASPGTDARSVFFVTGRAVGTDLHLIADGRPMPIDRLRTEVGPENCYDTAVSYRARVMRELFGIDDPVRYRNLIHLLYRLRRPTIGERLEAGELVSVLAEALPPMDDTVLDEMARNISDLEEARARLGSLTSAKEQVASFLTDYRGYLHGRLRAQARVVRDQIDAHRDRDTEVDRLREELDRLVGVESGVQEERDRLRRTRDTAASDAGTLTAGGSAPAPTEYEHQARHAAVAAYIRAAEATWAAADYALSAEEQAKEGIAGDIAAIERALTELRRLNGRLAESARAGGVATAAQAQVPHPVPTTLAPRESVTHVDLQGLEQAVERDPVAGVDVVELRARLAELHDLFGRADTEAAERIAVAAELRERAVERAAAERREAALDSEAEAADAALERAKERERAAIDTVRTASADYAAAVRDWSARLRAAAADHDITDALAALDEGVELPLTDELRVLDADVPAGIADRAHSAVDPLLHELRTRRDTAVGEERE
ncbi:exonuclease SbcC, partial [Nocardiopsis sediminis]